ncbi:MAG TPA: hypothetical protein VF780_09150, partial [Nitrosospira sp.]
MFNFGAFAGGLAQGIRSGQDLQIRRNTAARLAKADDREIEVHHARVDKAAFDKDRRNRLRAANEEIVAGWGKIRQGNSNVDIDPDKTGQAGTAAAGRSREKPLV